VAIQAINHARTSRLLQPKQTQPTINSIPPTIHNKDRNVIKKKGATSSKTRSLPNPLMIFAIPVIARITLADSENKVKILIRIYRSALAIIREDTTCDTKNARAYAYWVYDLETPPVK